MEEELQLEKELWFQEEVYKETVGSSSGNAVDTNYVNEGKQQYLCW